MKTGNPFIDLPPPEGFAKIRHPRCWDIFIERQMQGDGTSGNPWRWAFVAHTGIGYFVPGKYATREDAIQACDEKLATIRKKE